MDLSPKKKSTPSVEEVQMVLGYQYASKSKAFMDTLSSLYRTSRLKARQAYERNKDEAAYWTGRSDSLEAIIENCEDSEKVDLSKLTART